MNIQKLLRNKNFLNTNQFRKRKLLENYILKSENCKIGLKVICFEIENLVDEKNKFFYNQTTHKSIKGLTVGKVYEIIDINSDRIKIECDSGDKRWYTINRFFYSLKIERYEKLKKIEKLNKNER
jgi:hypothetical protein